MDTSDPARICTLQATAIKAPAIIKNGRFFLILAVLSEKIFISSSSLFSFFLTSFKIQSTTSAITPTIIVHASALIVENLGPEKRKTKTIRAVITPVFIPNCIIIATIGNSAKPVTTYVPTSPIAEIKSTGIPVNTALIPPIPVRQINPQSAPKIGASHFFGAAIPMISVARNNNHGFKRFVTNAFPIPTDAIKPTLSPNAIEAISPRCIRPSIYSGITGRIPS